MNTPDYYAQLDAMYPGESFTIVNGRAVPSEDAHSEWLRGKIKPGMDEAEYQRLVYGMDMAAASGRAVLQGHADYCAAHGHATNTVNGELQPYCARCDALLATPEDIDVSEFDVPSATPPVSLTLDLLGNVITYARVGGGALIHVARSSYRTVCGREVSHLLNARQAYSGLLYAYYSGTCTRCGSVRPTYDDAKYADDFSPTDDSELAREIRRDALETAAEVSANLASRTHG